MTGTIESHAVSGSKIWNHDKSLREKWVKLLDAQEHIQLALKREDEANKLLNDIFEKLIKFSTHLESAKMGLLSVSELDQKFIEMFLSVEGIPSKKIVEAKKR